MIHLRRGKFITYVGSDDTLAGKIEGQYLGDRLPEGGEVVYLVIEYGRSVTARRKAGFESVMKEHRNLGVVAELQGNASRANEKRSWRAFCRSTARDNCRLS
jgi:ABC-type sugar transport system substrate-binding protein